MDVTDRVAAILACSAVDPQLAGLLFYDLDPALIYPLARSLADLLGDTVEQKPVVIPIWSGMNEGMLWERIEPDREEHPEDLGFRLRPGPLAGYERRPGIVVVSDLALAGIPASRAAVTLIDAEVAHLERSGMKKMWHPRDRWLATLRRLEVGRVSAHLLDRFAVRVDAHDLRLPRGGRPILAQFDQWRQAVLAVRQGDGLPELSEAAADRVVDLIPPGTPGARRDLALARLARALAALNGEAEVLPAHVESAAELIGLIARTVPRSRGRHGGLGDGPEQTRKRFEPGPPWPDRENDQLPVRPGDDPVTLPSVPVEEPLAGPYPEDVVKPRRDMAPLRFGWQRSLTGPPRGAPIGTRRTLDKRDIAMFATLLNAARYQRLRCHRLKCPVPRRKGHRLHVSKPDLLSYRRAPRPGHLLVLVLDHTCRGEDWDWYPPLAPYLRWGYVNRALVGVVEMGAVAGDLKKELRASQFRSRGVLDPTVARALERAPGRAATPLAHGLTLAAGMLRHDTQQAGALVSEAFVVVVTDGRANVPLTASQTALPPASPVGRTAIADAKGTARAIKKLHRVRSAVIYPGPLSGAYFAADLAAELGATLVHGSPAPQTPAGPPRDGPARPGGDAP